jgi:type IV pilus assembly protein PilW
MKKPPHHVTCLAMHKKMHGFNLVELMVAVVIGLFITLGLSQIFLNMYSTSKFQTSLSQLQDNQRLALMMLIHSIELTGYYNDPTQLPASALPLTNWTNKDGSTFTAGIGIVGKGNGTGAGANSDTINIVYQSAGFNIDGIYNCQNGVAANNTSTIFANSFFIDNNKQLVCTVSTDGTNFTNPLTLATNVTSMKILYGVASSGGNSTIRYLSADDVTAASAWGNVRLAQITLTFQTNIPANPTMVWTQNINLMKTA